MDAIALLKADHEAVFKPFRECKAAEKTAPRTPDRVVPASRNT
ncbi:MAG: hypothetical protein JWM72_3000 [Actinomycetia bacterium]|jgi:hypothetical protein|nr:hypothetical protein [Actinomycetes bacterium]MDQ1461358.1 hypothetical protein [Actinomycetota bacterium]